MKPVVTPRSAREGCDDKEPGGVRRDEQGGEGGVDDRSCTALANELHEDDRRHRERDHGEVELDVREVVDDPLGDAERAVAAPELPVGAEGVTG